MLENNLKSDVQLCGKALTSVESNKDSVVFRAQRRKRVKGEDGSGLDCQNKLIL